jgi:hypothetical protein
MAMILKALFRGGRRPRSSLDAPDAELTPLDQRFRGATPDLRAFADNGGCADFFVPDERVLRW